MITPAPQILPGDHHAYMRYALSLAETSPPKPTNYRVGALLLSTATNTILATGYTLELPGNTHAEQVCLMKLSDQHQVPEELLSEVLPVGTVLYTTVEPCAKRMSGNLPCVERILRLSSKVKTTYVGVREPDKFVEGKSLEIGRKRMQEQGIDVVLVQGLEKEILEVAQAGHESTS